MSTYNINNGDSCLRISRLNGSVAGMTVRGKERLLPAKGGFSLRFLDAKGEYIRIDSSEFATFELVEKENGASCQYVNGTTFPTLKVEIEIRSGTDGFFRFRSSISGIPSGSWLELVDAPQIVVSPENELFWPYSEGCLIRDVEKRTRAVRQIQFPDTDSLGFYPGICQMQFMASYSSDGGVYFAADDYTHSSKTLEFSNDGESRLRLRIECCSGNSTSPVKEYVSPYEIVLKGFEGNWMDACAIYREWVKCDPEMQRPVKQPRWMDDSPIIVIYPVRGTGKITNDPNRFLPYDSAFPLMKELNKKFDSPVMPLLMRWENGAPWAPPYGWPPIGGMASFFRFRDLLHESGNYLGLYCSGTAFTRKSLINNYSLEEKFQKENLTRFMARGPKGEIRAHICSNLRDGCEICISEEWGRETLRAEVKLLAKAGIDYLQLFDQNLGCASFVCYSKEHSHPPVPGTWQTTAMQKLIDDMNNDIKQLGSEMILGTECAAAGPYISRLPFNDLRACFSVPFGMPVPAYQFVYHRYVNNFLGNQCVSWHHLDCKDAPDNLLFRIAEGFVAGEFLTVTLRDSGEIDWGAAADWNQAAPQQEPIFTLIRNLNHYRKIHSDFLRHGEMQKPICEIKSNTYSIRRRRGDLLTNDSILHSSWTAPSGRRGQFLVNFQKTEQVAGIRVPDGLKIRVEGKQEEKSGRFQLTIPPLSVQLLEVISTQTEK